MSNFSSNLCRLMEDRGLSIAEMYEKTGIAKSGISKYRQGKSKPTAKSITRMANVLGVSDEELTGANTAKNYAGIAGGNSHAVKVAGEDISGNRRTTEAGIDKDVDKVLEQIFTIKNQLTSVEHALNQIYRKAVRG